LEGGRPDGHAQQHPSFVPLEAFCGSTAPEGKEEVGLYDLDGFVALCRDGEGEGDGKVSEAWV